MAAAMLSVEHDNQRQRILLTIVWKTSGNLTSDFPDQHKNAKEAA